MICRRFRTEDKAAVLSILRGTFPDWDGEWAEAYWSWKFEQNPHGPARIWVGDDEGRIAGCYIWNPVCVWLGDRTLFGAQAVDAAVHSDYQGRGLFTELVRTAMDDDASREFALVYAFPVEAAFRGQVRVGFKPQGTISAVHRPLLISVLRGRRFDGLALGEAASFASRFDAFSNSGSPSELTVRRDAAYLQWRYRAHPTRSYETLVCERDGKLCGYCVLQVDPPGGRLTRGYVVDLQVLPDSGRAAVFLVDRALKRLRARGARVAISWVRPSGPEQDALASMGFSPRYQSIHRRIQHTQYAPQFIMYEHPAGKLRELLDRRGADPPPWSLVPGDHDSM